MIFWHRYNKKKNKIGKTYNQIKESYVWILSCVYKIYIYVCVCLYVTQLAKDSNKAIQKKSLKEMKLGEQISLSTLWNDQQMMLSKLDCVFTYVSRCIVDLFFFIVINKCDWESSVSADKTQRFIYI